MGFSKTYIKETLVEPEAVEAGGLEICVFSSPEAKGDRDNQDAAAVVEVENGVVLVVADGAGGIPGGAGAAARAVTAIAECLWDTEVSVRESILNGFEEANQRAREKGGATTLAVVEFSDGQLRSYHAGDSQVIVTGQRGRCKLQTLAHSPVGYAVEAGVLSEKDALQHEDRHLVSNLIGSRELKIEMGPPLEIAPRDTLIMGSDGVFDNASMEEAVNAVRIGSLPTAARRLRDLCLRRMAGRGAGPSKPDDLTFLLARRAMRRPRSESSGDDQPGLGEKQ